MEISKAVKSPPKRRQYRQGQEQTQANSSLAAAGANFGSVAGGVLGNIEGSLGQNSLALAQNINIGEELFTANEATSNAKADLSTANATVDVGRSLFSSSEKIGNIGATLFDPKAAK
jgi:Na+/glutamate symporter